MHNKRRKQRCRCMWTLVCPVICSVFLHPVLRVWFRWTNFWDWSYVASSGRTGALRARVPRGLNPGTLTVPRSVSWCRWRCTRILNLLGGRNSRFSCRRSFLGFSIGAKCPLRTFLSKEVGSSAHDDFPGRRRLELFPCSAPRFIQQWRRAHVTFYSASPKFHTFFDLLCHAWFDSGHSSDVSHKISLFFFLRDGGFGF